MVLFTYLDDFVVPQQVLEISAITMTALYLLSSELLLSYVIKKAVPTLLPTLH